jgi:hypothetical protein
MEDLEDLLLQVFFQKICVCEFLALDLHGQVIQEVLSGFYSDVAGDQDFLKLGEQTLVDLLLTGDKLVDLADQAFVGLEKAFFEALEKPLFPFGHHSSPKKREASGDRKKSKGFILLPPAPDARYT